MNTFQSITRQLEQFCRFTRHSWFRTHSFQNGKTIKSKPEATNSFPPTPDQIADSIKQKLEASAQLGSPLLLGLAVVSLTGVMGVRFYNQPTLTVGKEAPETVTAPENAEILDETSTQAKRTLVKIPPVMVADPTINREIQRKIQAVLDLIDQTRKGIEPFPYYNTAFISTDVQHYLRSVPEPQWRELELQFDQTALIPQSQSIPAVPISNSRLNQLVSAQIQQQEAIRQKAYRQLQVYQQKASPEEFTRLIRETLGARKRYFQTISALSQQSNSQLKLLKTLGISVLQWSDPVWLKTKAGIRQIQAQMLIQGIAAGIPKAELERAIRLQVSYLIPEDTQSFATQLLTESLKTNLKEDPEATRLRLEEARRNVSEVKINIQAGDVIVKAGETISQEAFVLLDYFDKSERGVNWTGLLGFIAIIKGSVILILLVGQRSRPSLRRRDYLLLLILTLSPPLLLLLNVPFAPNLPTVGLLAGSFYGSIVGVTTVGLLSVILPIGLEVDMILLIASAAGGIVGSLIAGQLRSREELALLGGAVGVTQGFVFFIIALILSSSASSIWYLLLGNGFLQILVGLAWSIVALGLSPYLEHLFDVITPIRLAELANPNRPLLKRLATEAPGTFQHTMFVATLAEAAAQVLGCNVELVRTGTLYHDIGKMHDPFGFIENQMGGPNKHDEIDDPWVSAQIIKKHVSEGLVMAKKCRLPKAIRAFIPEHQGNMLIAYFYHQAQQWASKDPSLVVREEDFRYDGPIPQSKETGIVMLADSCEAALRSLKDATHEQALQMVNKILKARWQDKQLIDSGLQREDMAKIAEVFVRVWEQVNHKRIAYPKGVFRPR